MLSKKVSKKLGKFSLDTGEQQYLPKCFDAIQFNNWQMNNGWKNESKEIDQ